MPASGHAECSDDIAARADVLGAAVPDAGTGCADEKLTGIRDHFLKSRGMQCSDGIHC